MRTFSILKAFSFFAVFLAVSPLYAANTLSVSPLKYELSIDAGKSESQIIKITNNSDAAMTLYTSKEDFIAGDDSGTPKFVTPQEQTNPELSLSNWVKIENENVTLAKGESREIRFTVTVPKDGEPGGHYGAIFFSPGAPNGAQVSVVQRLGVLLLVNVPGEVKIDGNLTGFQIGQKAGSAFTEGSEFQSFPILFETKFQNNGNTHLKPTGKVELIDENGETLKNVGKEVITSPAGTFLGEKMVDYIPVNDGGGNVLPKSERRFESDWEGFGYQVLNEDGTKTVKFKNLTEYYADKAAEKRAYLKFYEAVHTHTVSKKITANLSLSYEGKDKEKKNFQDSKTFTVTYEEQYVGMNYFVIIGLVIILGGAFYYVFVLVPRSRERLKAELLAQMKNEKAGK